MPGPLSHVTVIELAGIGPGPFACMLLADMGAQVIRIDRLPVASTGGLEDLLRNDSEQGAAKLEEITKASVLWDKRVVNMQVTDFKIDTMEVRMLVSAANAGRVFDLRCEVREKMIAWLQQEYPHALPRRRADLRAFAGRHPARRGRGPARPRLLSRGPP